MLAGRALRGWMRHPLFAVALLIAAVLGASPGFQYLTANRSLAIERILDVPRELTTASEGNFFTNNWLAAFDEFRANPATVLVGVGYAKSTVESDVFFGDFEVHNAYLAMLLAYGLIGSCLFLCALLFLWRSLGRTRLSSFELTCLAAFSFSALFQYTWNARTVWLLFATQIVRRSCVRGKESQQQSGANAELVVASGRVAIT